MSDYFHVKKSQMNLFRKTPLYYQTRDNSFILYKKSGELLESVRREQGKHPVLFVHKDDREAAIKELFETLNGELKEQCLLNDLKKVRSTLYLIVEEAIFEFEGENLKYLPETVSILFDVYSRETSFLGILTQVRNTSRIIVEHTINVMLLTLRFCFYHKLPEDQTKHLTLCALVHDVGFSKIEQNLVEAEHRLSDEEFKVYATHPALGHDLIKKEAGLSSSVAQVAMAHHERIDGSGYPEGKKEISEDAQIIGLIDSYEPLTYRNKSYRQTKDPFDALSLIKDEVIQGKFSVSLFKKMCASLSG